MKTATDPGSDPAFTYETRIKFEARMNRLMQAASAKNDSELARALGITPQSVAPARSKLQIPSSWIERIAELSGWSSDWIFFGRGPMRFGDSPEKPDQPQPALPAGSPCERCAKLETELEEERRERRELTVENRELTTENRQLWKENGDLRERCARLEGQGALDACLPFKKLPNTQSSDRTNS